MVEEGADLLDVGGESTRPGAQPLDEAEERRRVLPVIEGLAARVARPDLGRHLQGGDRGRGARGRRVDRQRHQRPALRAGAGGRSWREHGAPIVLMHTRGRSRDMYQQASYHDVVDEVLDELRESMAFAAGAGIAEERMLVDPGLGFAKEAPHSYEVLGAARRVRRARPAARRRAVAQVVSRRGRSARDGAGRRRATGRRPPRSTAAVLAGAHIVRVHAVREMVQVVRVADEIRKYHRERRLMDWLTELLRRARRRRGGICSTSRSSSFLIYELLLLIRGTRAVQMALSGGFLIGAVLPVALAAARDGQLGHPQPGGLRRVRDHRAVPGRHPPRARALRPRAVLPLLRARAERRRDDRGARGRGDARWPRAASARSSSSSGRSACATTSRAASRSTRLVTYDLLASIFQPGSPLHDGAVIVQGDRIAAAACFLPLSVNPRVSRELGTRHRAALGLTEENDAVAIVVSEETGSISLVDRRRHRARHCRRTRCGRGCGRCSARRRRDAPRARARGARSPDGDPSASGISG